MQPTEEEERSGGANLSLSLSLSWLVGYCAVFVPSNLDTDTVPGEGGYGLHSREMFVLYAAFGCQDYILRHLLIVSFYLK